MQEGHHIQAYDGARDQLAPAAALETVYDLISGRYLTLAMNNEEPETLEKDYDVAFFDPSNVSKQATK